MHIASYTRLFITLVVLFLLTAVTVGASYVDFGALNVWVALLIASTKASLVLIFFMHIGQEGRLMVLSFLTTLFFLAIMISFTFWDVAFRGKLGI
ncbi:MAG: cytochrome C oxidase subunit IV family protein [Desulfobacterales bacterium]|nr:cytochrome C oxidase subunit IV family protein [Desulfobacterales bacterium]